LFFSLSIEINLSWFSGLIDIKLPLPYDISIHFHDKVGLIIPPTVF
jgi:hypothetical protein